MREKTGLACIAASWLLIAVGLLMTPDGGVPPEIKEPVALMICAVALMGFGVGWIVRDEGGAR